ncbi:MAG: hypothetical protein HND43_01875 [Armatimonadetes bacterium]|nr:hypothetical protein [Armatimonadota bacterium]NOG38130.1 hypothetical protein [Armatimonadota bacterium]GIK31915.1 MAG: hypothetical protein BroJett009_09070 [Armatimonadota bacterium]
MASKKTKKGKKRRPGLGMPVAVGLLGLLVVGGLAAYVAWAPADRIPDWLKRPDKRTTSRPVEPTVTPELTPEVEQEVILLSPSYVGGELGFTETVAKVPQGEDPKAFVLNRFLDAAAITAADVRVLSVHINSDGLAALSFNKSLGQGLGSMDESTLVNGLRSVIGQFPEVNSMEMFADGEKIDTLGHFDFSEPIPVKRPSEWHRDATPSEAPEPSPTG